jgi:hypothetical protein
MMQSTTLMEAIIITLMELQYYPQKKENFSQKSSGCFVFPVGWITTYFFIVIKTYNDTRRDPNADTGGRWFESLIFINRQGAGRNL